MDGCDIETEFRQARDEGRDLSSVEGEFDALLSVPRPANGAFLGDQRDEAWMLRAGALVDKVQSLPMRADYAYREPEGLEEIRAARPEAVEIASWAGSDAEWRSRLHGGLLGRIAGCMLGKPVEGWHRASIQATGQATGNWPLVDYLRFPTNEENVELDKVQPKHRFHREHRWMAALLKDGMDGMVEDDDINYTTIGFAVVKQYGAVFTPLDVAAYWLGNVPILHTCTAERAAYRNFVGNTIPPGSARYRNPYREWIGAQIRADYFGYANPGRPEQAAEWAWRDASISHIKNGIYGEMWVAAMLAAAYVETDWVKIIHAGLAQIPAKSRLREDIEKIIAAHGAGAKYDDAVSMVHSQWDEKIGHHWCHTNSNAQIVAIGLLYGEDDYEKTITRAVMAAFDTDCNGATCGSLWGVKHGVDMLPTKWTEPLRDRVRTGVHEYHDVTISKLAADMATVAISCA
jgi:ADP-ribosylglycohydrolase